MSNRDIISPGPYGKRVRLLRLREKNCDTQETNTTQKTWSEKSQLSGNEERILIQRLKTRDQKAFEAIFNLYVSRVYCQALKLVRNEADAEDVVQEVFFLINSKAKSFLGKSEFSTWLYRLAANRQIIQQAIDQLSPIDKAVVIMGDQEELSNPEIGKTLELPSRQSKLGFILPDYSYAVGCDVSFWLLTYTIVRFNSTWERAVNPNC